MQWCKDFVAPARHKHCVPAERGGVARADATPRGRPNAPAGVASRRGVMRLRRLGLSSRLGLAAIGLLRTRRQRCVLHACFAAAGSHAQPPAPRGSVPGRPASRRRCLRAPPRLLARGRTRRRSCAAHLWLPDCACSRRGTPDDRGARSSAVDGGGTAACSCSLGQRRPRSAPRSVHRGVRTFVAPATAHGARRGTLYEACARRGPWRSLDAKTRVPFCPARSPGPRSGWVTRGPLTHS